MERGSVDAVNRARGIADRDYTAYGGQRIADLSSNEQMGVNMARANVGAYAPYYDRAAESLEGIGSAATPGALEGYMNPYMEQVLAPQIRGRNEAFEAERAGRRATAGMRGAFGGRQDLYESQLTTQYQRDVDDLRGAAYGAAYDRAMAAFQTEQDRKLGVAGAYQGLGTATSMQRRQDLRDLMTTVLTERTRDQADLDFQYLEHLEERDWDIGNLDVLVKTLASVPHSYTTYGESTTETKQSSMKTLAGIGAITAGAIMTGGASLAAGGSFWGAIGEQMLGLGMNATAEGGED